MSDAHRRTARQGESLNLRSGRRYSITFIAVDTDTVQLTLWGQTGAPLTTHPLTATMAGKTTELTTDGEGRARIDLVEGADEVVVRWHDGGPRQKTYYPRVEDAESDRGQERLLSNLFFLQPALRTLIEQALDASSGLDVAGLEGYQQAMGRALKLLDLDGES